MTARKRGGVSAFLETFMLIAMAVGCSGLVLGWALGPASAVRGRAVSVPAAAIRQRAPFSFETLTIQNTGDAPFQWFRVSTSGVPSSASYCYTLYDPALLTTTADTCPGMSANPGVVSVSASIPPGKAVVLELILDGAAFSPGTAVSVAVVTSSGAAQGTEVSPVPA